MEEKKPDRRVIKTKRAIRSAFAELLAEKEISAITIKEIADRADINRKTFYHYYAGVHQVMDEIENEIVSAFEADLTDFDFRRDIQEPKQMFSKLSGMIHGDQELYDHLFRAENNSHLLDKVTQLLREKTVACLRGKYAVDPVVLQVIADYTISGATAVYRSWLHRDYQASQEELAGILGELMANGIKAYLPPRKPDAP